MYSVPEKTFVLSEHVKVLVRFRSVAWRGVTLAQIQVFMLRIQDIFSVVFA